MQEDQDELEPNDLKKKRLGCKSIEINEKILNSRKDLHKLLKCQMTSRR